MLKVVHNGFQSALFFLAENVWDFQNMCHNIYSNLLGIIACWTSSSANSRGIRESILTMILVVFSQGNQLSHWINFLIESCSNVSDSDGLWFSQSRTNLHPWYEFYPLIPKQVPAYLVWCHLDVIPAFIMQSEILVNINDRISLHFLLIIQETDHLYFKPIQVSCIYFYNLL